MTTALTPVLNLQEDATLGDLRRAGLRLKEQDQQLFYSLEAQISDDDVAPAVLSQSPRRTEMTIFAKFAAHPVDENDLFERWIAIRARLADGTWHKHSYDDFPEYPYRNTDSPFSAVVTRHLDQQRSALTPFFSLRAANFQAQLEAWAEGSRNWPPSWAATLRKVPAFAYFEQLGDIKFSVMPVSAFTFLRSGLPSFSDPAHRALMNFDTLALDPGAVSGEGDVLVNPMSVQPDQVVQSVVGPSTVLNAQVLDLPSRGGEFALLHVRSTVTGDEAMHLTPNSPTGIKVLDHDGLVLNA